MVKTFDIPLKEIRKKAGFSQEDLAARAGISARAVQEIENGRSSPTISTLNALAAALSIPITAFFPVEKVFIKPPQISGPRLADRVLILELLAEKIPAQVRNHILTSDVNWLNAAPALGIDPDAVEELRLVLKKREGL